MTVAVTGRSRADFAQCQQVKRCAEAFANDLQVSKGCQQLLYRWREIAHRFSPQGIFSNSFPLANVKLHIRLTKCSTSY